MSVINDKNTATAATTTTTHRSSSGFLCCFGFSGKRMQRPLNKTRSGSHHRSRRWLSRWKFHLKKSDGKTVPVDQTTSPRKPSLKSLDPAAINRTVEIEVIEEDRAFNPKPVTKEDNIYEVKDFNEQVIVLEDFKKENNLDSNHAMKHKTSRRRSSCSLNQKERKAAAATAKGAPVLNDPGTKSLTITHSRSQTLLLQSSVSSPMKSLTHSISLPRHEVKGAPPTRAAGRVEERNSSNTLLPDGKFDSLIGLSIILVTLVIMLLWGKLCAILCTSAWFFMATRLGTATGRSDNIAKTAEGPKSDDLDMDSVEYKKKVVLEGFLQRNKRKVVEFL